MIFSEQIIKQNLPKNIIQPRRAPIYVGFKCSQKCGFCYYKYKCDDPMFSIDYIKKQIDFEYAYGIRDFEITGGEPSEYKNLRTICEYIKEKNNKNHISIITNGGLWNSNIWDLIDEVLLSYHIGKNEKYINKKFFPYGNTYIKVKKTLDIAKTKNILIRTNTVLGEFNIYGISNIINDLIDFQPHIINFLPINLFDQASNLSSYINYQKLRLILKHSIDILLNNNLTNINIRYMPFCDMHGYEKYIVGTLQHIYDKFDWNVELSGTELLKIIEDYSLQSNLGIYGSTSIKKALEIRHIFYRKISKCSLCKYNIICDGIEHLALNKNINAFKPSYGKIIKNICYFR